MSESANLYRCTPRQIRAMIVDILYAGLVPFVRSSPGLGKSSIMRSICTELNLGMIDHRLSTSDPTDLSGLPHFVNGMARFAPFNELFPIQSTPVPKDKDGWMVFFDEFNSAKKDVMAACYKTILDRAVGQHKLHDQVVMCAAGNLDSDRAIVNPISTAMQSRVVTLEMEVSHKEWLEDVAIPEKYDSRIVAYLNQYPSKLMDFRPDHNEATFCCPRTWEFMNRLIKGKTFALKQTSQGDWQYEMDGKAAMYAGTITAGVAVDFIQFTRVFHNLVKLRDVLSDPEHCPISNDSATRWATISMLIEHVNEDNFGEISSYADRFSLDFRLLFFRSIMAQQPGLREHPAFAISMKSLANYLHT